MKEQLDLLLLYLHATWLRRRWMIAIFWIVGLIGWPIVTSLPNQYTSEARIFADTRSILQPLLQGLAIENDPTQELNLMVKTLLSRNNLETIARYTDADIQASNNQEYEAILDDFKNNIKLRSTGKENLFTISYSGKQPEHVKNVVQASLDVFVENAVGQKRQDTNKANEFINNQLKEYEGRLINAEQNLAEFKRNNAGFMPGSERNFYSRLEGVQSELESTQLYLQETESQLRTAQKQLQNEQAQAAKQSSGLSTEFDLRLENLESRLDSLLFRYTERHPDVKETRRQIAELKILQQQAQQQASSTSALSNNSVFQDIRLTISKLENQAASLQARSKNQQEKMTFLNQKVRQLPKIEAELTNMMRNYEITKTKYEDLLSRREAAMISKSVGAASDQITFRVIDPPMVPQKPSGPPRLILTSFVFIIAIIAGVGSAFVISQLAPVSQSSLQLYNHTSLPVFGVVSFADSLQPSHEQKAKLLLFSGLVILSLFTYLAFMALNASERWHSFVLQGVASL